MASMRYRPVSTAGLVSHVVLERSDVWCGELTADVAVIRRRATLRRSRLAELRCNRALIVVAVDMLPSDETQQSACRHNVEDLQRKNRQFTLHWCTV